MGIDGVGGPTTTRTTETETEDVEPVIAEAPPPPEPSRVGGEAALGPRATDMPLDTGGVTIDVPRELEREAEEVSGDTAEAMTSHVEELTASFLAGTESAQPEELSTALRELAVYLERLAVDDPAMAATLLERAQTVEAQVRGAEILRAPIDESDTPPHALALMRETILAGMADPALPCPEGGNTATYRQAVALANVGFTPEDVEELIRNGGSPSPELQERIDALQDRLSTTGAWPAQNALTLLCDLRMAAMHAHTSVLERERTGLHAELAALPEDDPARAALEEAIQQRTDMIGERADQIRQLTRTRGHIASSGSAARVEHADDMCDRADRAEARAHEIEVEAGRQSDPAVIRRATAEAARLRDRATSLRERARALYDSEEAYAGRIVERRGGDRAPRWARERVRDSYGGEAELLVDMDRSTIERVEETASLVGDDISSATFVPITVPDRPPHMDEAIEALDTAERIVPELGADDTHLGRRMDIFRMDRRYDRASITELERRRRAIERDPVITRSERDGLLSVVDERLGTERGDLGAAATELDDIAGHRMELLGPRETLSGDTAVLWAELADERADLHVECGGSARDVEEAASDVRRREDEVAGLEAQIAELTTAMEALGDVWRENGHDPRTREEGMAMRATRDRLEERLATMRDGLTTARAEEERRRATMAQYALMLEGTTATGSGGRLLVGTTAIDAIAEADALEIAADTTYALELNRREATGAPDAEALRVEYADFLNGVAAFAAESNEVLRPFAVEPAGEPRDPAEVDLPDARRGARPEVGADVEMDGDVRYAFADDALLRAEALALAIADPETRVGLMAGLADGHARLAEGFVLERPTDAIDHTETADRVVDEEIRPHDVALADQMDDRVAAAASRIANTLFHDAVRMREMGTLDPAAGHRALDLFQRLVDELPPGSPLREAFASQLEQLHEEFAAAVELGDVTDAAAEAGMRSDLERLREMEEQADSMVDMRTSDIVEYAGRVGIVLLFASGVGAPAALAYLACAYAFDLPLGGSLEELDHEYVRDEFDYREDAVETAYERSRRDATEAREVFRTALAEGDGAAMEMYLSAVAYAGDPTSEDAARFAGALPPTRFARGRNPLTDTPYYRAVFRDGAAPTAVLAAARERHSEVHTDGTERAMRGARHFTSEWADESQTLGYIWAVWDAVAITVATWGFGSALAAGRTALAGVEAVQIFLRMERVAAALEAMSAVGRAARAATFFAESPFMTAALRMTLFNSATALAGHGADAVFGRGSDAARITRLGLNFLGVGAVNRFANLGGSGISQLASLGLELGMGAGTAALTSIAYPEMLEHLDIPPDETRDEIIGILMNSLIPAGVAGVTHMGNPRRAAEAHAATLEPGGIPHDIAAEAAPHVRELILDFERGATGLPSEASYSALRDSISGSLEGADPAVARRVAGEIVANMRTERAMHLALAGEGMHELGEPLDGPAAERILRETATLLSETGTPGPESYARAGTRLVHALEGNPFAQQAVMDAVRAESIAFHVPPERRAEVARVVREGYEEARRTLRTSPDSRLPADFFVRFERELAHAGGEGVDVSAASHDMRMELARAALAEGIAPFIRDGREPSEREAVELAERLRERTGLPIDEATELVNELVRPDSTAARADGDALPVREDPARPASSDVPDSATMFAGVSRETMIRDVRAWMRRGECRNVESLIRLLPGEQATALRSAMWLAMHDMTPAERTAMLHNMDSWLGSIGRGENDAALAGRVTGALTAAAHLGIHTPDGFDALMSISETRDPVRVADDAPPAVRERAEADAARVARYNTEVAPAYAEMIARMPEMSEAQGALALTLLRRVRLAVDSSAETRSGLRAPDPAAVERLFDVIAHLPEGEARRLQAAIDSGSDSTLALMLVEHYSEALAHPETCGAAIDAIMVAHQAGGRPETLAIARRLIESPTPPTRAELDAMVSTVTGAERGITATSLLAGSEGTTDFYTNGRYDAVRAEGRRILARNPRLAAMLLANLGDLPAGVLRSGDLSAFSSIYERLSPAERRAVRDHLATFADPVERLAAMRAMSDHYFDHTSGAARPSGADLIAAGDRMVARVRDPAARAAAIVELGTGAVELRRAYRGELPEMPSTPLLTAEGLAGTEAEARQATRRAAGLWAIANLPEIQAAFRADPAALDGIVNGLRERLIADIAPATLTEAQLTAYTNDLRNVIRNFAEAEARELVPGVTVLIPPGFDPAFVDAHLAQLEFMARAADPALLREHPQLIIIAPPGSTSVHEFIEPAPTSATGVAHELVTMSGAEVRLTGTTLEGNGAEVPGTTAVHEFGHLLDIIGAITTRVDGRDVSLREFVNTYLSGRNREIASSFYGTVNPAEFIAEAIREYMGYPPTEGPSPARPMRERAPELYDMLHAFFGDPPARPLDFADEHPEFFAGGRRSTASGTVTESGVMMNLGGISETDGAPRLAPAAIVDPSEAMPARAEDVLAAAGVEVGAARARRRAQLEGFFDYVASVAEGGDPASLPPELADRLRMSPIDAETRARLETINRDRDAALADIPEDASDAGARGARIRRDALAARSEALAPYLREAISGLRLDRASADRAIAGLAAGRSTAAIADSIMPRGNGPVLAIDAFHAFLESPAARVGSDSPIAGFVPETTTSGGRRIVTREAYEAAVRRYVESLNIDSALGARVLTEEMSRFDAIAREDAAGRAVVTEYVASDPLRGGQYGRVPEGSTVLDADTVRPSERIERYSASDHGTPSSRRTGEDGVDRYRVGTGERVIRIVRPGESVELASTDYSSCAGIAISGTDADGNRVVLLGHAMEGDSGTQITRLRDDIAALREMGVSDLHIVVSADPAARGAIPADAASPEHFYTFPSERELAGALGSDADLISRIEVVEAPTDESGFARHRHMIVDGDGVTIAYGDSLREGDVTGVVHREWPGAAHEEASDIVHAEPLETPTPVARERESTPMAMGRGITEGEDAPIRDTIPMDIPAPRVEGEDRPAMVPPPPVERLDGAEPILTAPRVEDVAAARARIAALREGELASPEDVAIILRQTAYAARESLRIAYTGRPGDPFSAEHIGGWCGFGQAATTYALMEMGIPAEAIHLHQARDLFGTENSFRHGFITVDMPDGRTYLVDTTFRQFVGEDPAAEHDVLMPFHPGYILRRTEEGRAFMNTLTRDGMIELTPENAALYAAALSADELTEPFPVEAYAHDTVEIDFERSEIPGMPAPPEPAVLPEPDPAVRERPRHALVPDRPRGPFPTLAERFPASDPGVVDGMTRVADTRTVDYPLAQLQEKYASHGEIFGLTDPANPARIAEFRAAIDAHIHDPGTIPYAGTYHGASVIEFYNPTTGIDVLVLPNGEFLSCWRVSEGQADRIARLTPL